KRFGQTAVLWEFHTRKPKKVFHVPGAPLEIRWASRPNHNYAFTAAALTSRLWLFHEDPLNGEWHATDVGPIGDPASMPIPVDMSLSSDDSTLFVDCFGDGVCRIYDVRDPFHPRLITEEKIGRQVN